MLSEKLIKELQKAALDDFFRKHDEDVKFEKYGYKNCFFCSKKFELHKGYYCSKECFENAGYEVCDFT